jgi:hypothetical protein
MACQHTYIIQNFRNIFSLALEVYCLLIAVPLKIINRFTRKNKALFTYKGYVLVEASGWHKVSSKTLRFSILVLLEAYADFLILVFTGT